MVPKCVCGPAGELKALSRPASWWGGGSLLLPESRILSIVNEMRTLCVNVKASVREVILGSGSTVGLLLY